MKWGLTLLNIIISVLGTDASWIVIICHYKSTYNYYVIHHCIRFICRFHQSIWCYYVSYGAAQMKHLLLVTRNILWIKSPRIILIYGLHIPIWKANYCIWKLWRKAVQGGKKKTWARVVQKKLQTTTSCQNYFESHKITGETYIT